MWFSKLSIKHKILVIFIPVLVVMITIGIISIRNITANALDANQRSSLDIIGRLTAEAVRMGVEFGDQDMVKKSVAGFLADDNISLIQITDAKGKTYFDYRKKGLPEINVSKINGIMENQNEMFIRLPIMDKQKPIGTAAVGISLQSRNAALNTAMSIVLLLGILGLLFFAVFVIYFAGFLTKPLRSLQRMAAQLTRGHLNYEQTYKYNDELGDVFQSFKKTAESFTYKAQVLRDLANGDIETSIKVLSEEDELGKALIEVQKSLRIIVTEIKDLVEHQKQGQINARGDVKNLQGAYKEVIDGLNEALDVLTAPLKETILILNEYADGNLEHELRKLPGDLMQLTEAINTIRTNLNRLVEESVRLTREAKVGNLSYRGDTSRFQGGYQAILSGFNEAMDAIIRPLNESARAMALIARGEIPELISNEYPGDFNKLKESINQCITAINNLIVDSNALIEGALQGKLDLRVDDSKHQGDFRKIVSGFNETLDALTFPMNEILAALERISEGDLTVEITGEHQGDLGRMKNALNKTLKALNKIMANIAESVDQIRNGAHQVADSSQAVSQGATEQAGSLEETTVSIEEIASQAKQNAEHAQTANQISKEASQAAEAGNQQMERMLDAMQEINNSSNQIAKIIKVIDEIAFQTNLLSLNAAVEAARAGVHGKGFAVVAEEVRNLAQRSAKAAKETEKLIEGSVEKIRVGADIADQTAHALESIISNITKVNDLMDEIASASAEQVEGIEQISQALKQVDDVTQANAASAEQSASAAEELSGQALNLQKLVGRFRLTRFEFASKQDEPFTSQTMAQHATWATKALHGNGNNGNGNGHKDPHQFGDDVDFGDF